MVNQIQFWHLTRVGTLTNEIAVVVTEDHTTETAISTTSTITTIVTTTTKEVTLTAIEVMGVIETITLATAILLALPNNIRKTKKVP